MKENRKTLIIIAILIISMLSCGLFYNIVKAANPGGVGSKEDAKPGEHYIVSIVELCDLGLFRWWRCWLGNLYCRR